MVDDFKEMGFSGHKEAYTQELTVVVAAYTGYRKTQVRQSPSKKCVEVTM